jgi:hypothetical protein
MDGAGWIDVESESYPPGAAAWVVVPPPGRGVTADTPEWRGLWHRVEKAATAALIAIGAPF